MKATVSYDFGSEEFVSPSDIKITVNIEGRLGDSFIIPEIRSVIAGGLAPLLKQLKMSDRSIDREVEALMMSGILYRGLKYPYYYNLRNRDIRSLEDKNVKYSIRDYLEGKVPDLSV